MTAEKAIEILSLALKPGKPVSEQDLRDAIHLSIASLNLYRSIEKQLDNFRWQLIGQPWENKP